MSESGDKLANLNSQIEMIQKIDSFLLNIEMKFIFVIFLRSQNVNETFHVCSTRIHQISAIESQIDLQICFNSNYVIVICESVHFQVRQIENQFFHANYADSYVEKSHKLLNFSRRKAKSQNFYWKNQKIKAQFQFSRLKAICLMLELYHSAFQLWFQCRMSILSGPWKFGSVSVLNSVSLYWIQFWISILLDSGSTFWIQGLDCVSIRVSILCGMH